MKNDAKTPNAIPIFPKLNLLFVFPLYYIWKLILLKFYLIFKV